MVSSREAKVTECKTIFARMGNIKLGSFIDDETGDDLSDVEKILNRVGIRLRETDADGNLSTTFRNFGDVLDEVGAKWKTYTDLERSAIATAMAGQRQRNNFLALMDNYGKALDLETASMTSSGTAMRKQEVYAQSLEAKLNTLRSTFEDMINSFTSSDPFKNMVDGATKFLKIIGSVKNLLNFVVGLLLKLKSNQIGASLTNLTGSIANIIKHPLQTGKNIGKSIIGRGEKLSDDEWAGKYLNKSGKQSTIASKLGISENDINSLATSLDKLSTSAKGATQAVDTSTQATQTGTQAEMADAQATNANASATSQSASAETQNTTAVQSNTQATQANTGAVSSNTGSKSGGIFGKSAGSAGKTMSAVTGIAGSLMMIGSIVTSINNGIKQREKDIREAEINASASRAEAMANLSEKNQNRNNLHSQYLKASNLANQTGDREDIDRKYALKRELVETLQESGALSEGSVSSFSDADIASALQNQNKSDLSTTRATIAGNTLDQKNYGKARLSTDVGAEVGDALSSAGTGAMIGASVGGVIGSVIPVVGTALGAAVGGALGAIGGAIASLFDAKEYTLSNSTTKDLTLEEYVNDLDSQIKDLETELDNTSGKQKRKDISDRIKILKEEYDSQKEILDNAKEELENAKQTFFTVIDGATATYKNALDSVGQDVFENIKQDLYDGVTTEDFLTEGFEDILAERLKNISGIIKDFSDSGYGNFLDFQQALFDELYGDEDLGDYAGKTFGEIKNELNSFDGTLSDSQQKIWDYIQSVENLSETYKILEGNLQAVRKAVLDTVSALEAQQKILNVSITQEKKVLDSIVSAGVEAGLDSSQLDKILGMTNGEINLGSADTSGVEDSALKSYLDGINEVYKTFTDGVEGITEDSILTEDYYQAQLDRELSLLQMQYEIDKKSLEIQEKQFALINALNERNTRMFVGDSWIWTANQDEVDAKKEEVESLEQEKLNLEYQKKIESHTNKQLDEMEKTNASLEWLKDHFENASDYFYAQELMELLGKQGIELDANVLEKLTEAMSVSNKMGFATELVAGLGEDASQENINNLVQLLRTLLSPEELQEYINKGGDISDALKEFLETNNVFDSGGVATGMGFMRKATVGKERVLSPQQTSSFDDLVYNKLPAIKDYYSGVKPQSTTSSETNNESYYINELNVTTTGGLEDLMSQLKQKATLNRSALTL